MLGAQVWVINQTDPRTPMTSLSESTLPAIDQQLSHPKYRPDIDGLRAIAVLSVVAFHAFPSLMKGGFVGVDVFFVISGFLISSIIFGSLEKNTFSFLSFYSRRVNRIFPALLLVLISTLAFGWFILLPDEYMQLGKHIAGGSAFVSNFVLLGEAGYFDNSAETKILLHLWSLGIEEQFYLIWPLMIWSAWKLRLNVLILIILVGVTSFALNIVNVQSDQVATFYSPQTRFWELLIGSLLAYVTMHKHQLFPKWRGAGGPTIRNIQSLVGAVFLASAFALTTKTNQFPGWWALLPTIGTTLIIAAGPAAWINRVVLSSRILVLVGLISFPLYLWHWPILSFARIIESGAPELSTRLVAVLTSIGLAWITYNFAEKKIRFNSRNNHTAALCIAISAVGIIGFSTYKFDGITSRFPSEIQTIANFKYDPGQDARAQDCWLSAHTPYNGFAEKCLSPLADRSAPEIFVWGDSYAARLYSGLHATSAENAHFLQATRDSCPPLLDMEYSNCIESNRFTLSVIKRIKPDTVIMFGVWGKYSDSWAAGTQQRKQLQRTISEARKAGAKQIIVLGPAPDWPDLLPKLVYKSWKDSYPLHKIPERLMSPRAPAIARINEELRMAVSESGAIFLSTIEIMCNPQGCLTHTPGSPEQLTSWDSGHLTTSGAVIISKEMQRSGLIP
ncbi:MULTISPECIES: acyltransferase family protein [Pseudomonas]|uniref:acyltransferase family protein n=1 Tax=Pseudomonas TaxID=286 RepID=UPI001C82D8CD|nr:MULTISPECIES: acyltransferase family protein [Pseudomonas]MDI1328925.1 acyltransferase family protein [Pseudomonas sp.]QZA96128.1 acyltransferase [Pseudomonas mandelii]